MTIIAECRVVFSIKISRGNFYYNILSARTNVQLQRLPLKNQILPRSVDFRVTSASTLSQIELS